MMVNPAWMLAFLFVCHCTQDVPIMPGGYGFSVGDPEATLRIEFFLDFQCICHFTKALTQNSLSAYGMKCKKNSVYTQIKFN